MGMYCQECGEKVEGNFQFCPFCGKKLIKPKICSNCGNKLKENFNFCPECGKKWDESKKAIIQKIKKEEKKEIPKDEPVKKVEEIKPDEKPKPVAKVKSKATKHKISLNFLGKIKRPGKKVLIIISVICIVIVVAAAMMLFNPFNTNVTSPGGGTLAITVENMHSDYVNYFLIIDSFPVVGSLDNPSVMGSNDAPLNLNINEDDLTIVKNVHTVTLFASLDDAVWESCKIFDVTQSASFEISVEIEAIVINCTASQ